MIEIDQAFVDSVIRPRDPETNKNDYGRILCVCGSAGYTARRISPLRARCAWEAAW